MNCFTDAISFNPQEIFLANLPCVHAIHIFKAKELPVWANVQGYPSSY